MSYYCEKFILYCENDDLDSVKRLCQIKFSSFFMIQQGIDVAVNRHKPELLKTVLTSSDNLVNKLMNYIKDKNYVDYAVSVLYTCKPADIVYILYKMIECNSTHIISWFSIYFDDIEYANVQNMLLEHINVNYKHENITKYIARLSKHNDIERFPNIKKHIDKLLYKYNDAKKLDVDMLDLFNGCRYAANSSIASNIICIIKKNIHAMLDIYMIQDTANLVIEYILYPCNIPM